MILSESAINFKHKSKQKIPKRSISFLLKCTFVIGVSLATLPIVNAYNQSKALDQVQHNVQNMKDYNNFAKALDSVPYNDEMFKKDLETFHLIFNSKTLKGKDYARMDDFYVAKYYLDGNKEKINEYTDHFSTLSEEVRNYQERFEIIKPYVYKNFEGKYEGNLMLLQAPYHNVDYIFKNWIKYTNDKGIPDNFLMSYYREGSSDYNKYLKQNPNSTLSINEYRKQKFVEDLKSMNDQQLRVMFSAINSYYKVIATNTVVSKINKEKISYLPNGIQYYMLGKMDSARNFFNKNGSVEIDAEHSINPDSEIKERFAGL